MALRAVTSGTGRVRTGARDGSGGLLSPALSLLFADAASLDPSVTYTGASHKTMYDSTGKLTYAPNNLLTLSNTFNDATWSKISCTLGGTATAPDGSVGTLIIPAAANTSHALLKSLTTSSNAIIWAVAKGDGTYNAITLANGPNNYVHFNLANGAFSSLGTGWASAGSSSLGNGWYLVWAVQQSATNFANANFYVLNTFLADGQASPTFNGDGVHGIYIAKTGVSAVTYETTPRAADQVITTSAAYYGPRVNDYDPVTLVSKGFLIEESRTNLTSHSVPDASWVPNDTVVTFNQAVAPDGTTTAAKIVQKTTGTAYIAGSPQTSSVSASPATASVYVKAAGYGFAYLYFANNSVAAFQYGASFNLTTGAVTQTVTRGGATGTAFAATSVGNGWWRISVTMTNPTTATTANFFVTGTATGTPSVDATYAFPTTPGDGTSGIYAWGGQIEQGSFATSYIPTAASAVTRAADVASMTGANFTSWYNLAAGTFVAQADVNTTAPTVGVVLSVNQGGNSYNNMVQIDLANAADTAAGRRWNAGVVTGSTVQALIPSLADDNTTSANKFAFASATNDFAYAQNGAVQGTDTSGTLPTLVNTLWVGSRDSSLQLNGHIAFIKYYNTRQTNAALVGFTT